MVTTGYSGLQGVTGNCKGVTSGDIGLKGVTSG